MDTSPVDKSTKTEMEMDKNSTNCQQNGCETKTMPRSGGFIVQRTFLSVCLYSTFFGLGLTACLMAPSFLHLAELYHTDVSGLSVMFTFMSVGYLVGALACAALFDRVSHELQYCLLNAVEAGMTIVIPMLPGLPYLFAVAFLQNVVMGYIDASGQSYVIQLWNHHRFKEPFMMVMHAVWSVGAFISPLIVAPFLAELPDKSTATTELPMFMENVTAMANVTMAYKNATPTVFDNTTLAEDEIVSLEDIRYPYIIAGCVLGTVSLLCLLSFCMYRNHSLTKSQKGEESEEQGEQKKTGEVLSFKLPMLVMQFFFFFFYIWCELIPGTLLATFVIQGLKWSIQDGARLMSVYWGGHTIGRLAGIPFSFCLKPFTMLFLNMGICVLAYVLMFIAPLTESALLWISAASAGFSISNLFASSILWMSEYIHISGAVGAFFLISASLGGMTGPTLAGFLFEHSSYMWVVILSLIASLMQGLVFVIMLVFVKVHDKKMKKLRAREKKVEGEPMFKIST